MKKRPVENPFQKRARRLHVLQWFSALVGVGLSLYLLVQHTRLKSGIQGSASICNAGTYVNCDAAASSSYSQFLGFPLPVWGALFYFLLFLGSALARPASPAFGGLQKWLGRLCALGLLVDIFLLGVQILVLKTLCLLCCATYLANLLYYVATSLMATGGFQGWRRFFLGPLSSDKRLKLDWKKAVGGGLALGLWLGLLYLVPRWIEMDAQLVRLEKEHLAAYLDAWKALPPSPLPSSAQDGKMGPEKAPIQLVVFSDFECPFCRKAAFILESFAKTQPHTLQMVFKNYPLDQSCNSQITQTMHTNACRLARLAVCANQKKVFWPYHDRVFFELNGGEDWPALVKALEPIFTAEEITKCLKNPASLAQVQADIRLGNSLQVRATPSVFINGKYLGLNLSLPVLQKLAELELESIKHHSRKQSKDSDSDHGKP